MRLPGAVENEESMSLRYRVDVIRATLAFMFLVSIVPVTSAQEGTDCENQMDQSTMTQCAGLDFEKADAELNRIWPEIKSGAQESDAGSGKSEHVDALMASQRAWLAYRDAECAWQGFEAHGGSMEPMLVNACLADMTSKHIKELQDDEAAGDQ